MHKEFKYRNGNSTNIGIKTFIEIKLKCIIKSDIICARACRANNTFLFPLTNLRKESCKCCFGHISHSLAKLHIDYWI